jgi:uncharacterized protein YgbK (DUF1537 family)
MAVLTLSVGTHFPCTTDMTAQALERLPACDSRGCQIEISDAVGDVARERVGTAEQHIRVSPLRHSGVMARESLWMKPSPRRLSPENGARDQAIIVVGLATALRPKELWLLQLRVRSS